MRRTTVWAVLFALMICCSGCGGCGGENPAPLPKPGDAPPAPPAENPPATNPPPAQPAPPAVAPPKAAPPAPNKFNLSYIDQNFATALILRPNRLLAAPLFESYLATPGIQEQIGVLKRLGVDPEKIDQIVVLTSPDASRTIADFVSGPIAARPEIPPAGIIIRMSEPIKLTSVVDNVSQAIMGGRPLRQVTVAEKPCYIISPTPPDVLACQADRTTILLGPHAGIQRMLAAPQGHLSPLTDLLGRIDVDGDIGIATLTGPFKAQLQPLAAGTDLSSLQKLSEEITALAVSVRLQGPSLVKIRIEAQTIEAIANVAMALASLKATADTALIAATPRMEAEGGEMGERAARLLTALLGGVHTDTDGTVCTVTIAKPEDFDSMVRFLVDQSIARAEEAAAQAERERRLHLVYEGVENLIAKYDSLPSPAIKGPDGLSWRAGMLKFIDEKAAFNLINFNFGWNAPRNATAVDKVIDAYNTAGTGDNKTTIMLVTGPGTLFPTLDSRPTMDVITDGPENTILAVLVSPRYAVPWIVPKDLTFDQENPEDLLDYFDGDRFTALMCNGSVKTFSKAVGPEALKALLSPAAGDTVDWDAIEAAWAKKTPATDPSVVDEIISGTQADIDFTPLPEEPVPAER